MIGQQSIGIQIIDRSRRTERAIRWAAVAVLWVMAGLVLAVSLLVSDPASPNRLPDPCHTGAPPVVQVCGSGSISTRSRQ